jgi:hypothetical protein
LTPPGISSTARAKSLAELSFVSELLSVSVRVVVRHHVEGVGDGEGARAGRDLFAAEAARVARAVPLLVVLDDGRGRAVEEGEAVEQRLAVVGVAAHHRPLVVRQPVGFVQHRVGHADLAHVVQERAEEESGRLGRS